eukprot:scaffold320733_cov21-Tisochrysis_lutea.AAC.1
MHHEVGARVGVAPVLPLLLATAGRGGAAGGARPGSSLLPVQQILALLRQPLQADESRSQDAGPCPQGCGVSHIVLEPSGGGRRLGHCLPRGL